MNKQKQIGRFKDCVICSGNIWVSPSREKTRKYCSKECYGVSKKGKVVHRLTRQERQKLRRRMTGKNNPNWKGGITKVLERLRKSSRYKSWRRRVFERDNYTCQICKKRGGVLNADHIKSFAGHEELRFKLSNGRTLCLGCHRKTCNYGGNSIK